MTWVIRSNEPCSNPFDRLTIGIQGWTWGRASSSVSRTAWVGTPTISTSAWRTARARSSVASSRGGSMKSVRYLGLRCSVLIDAATFMSRAQIIVSWRRAVSAATVVPHEPAPSTVIFMAHPAGRSASIVRSPRRSGTAPSGGVGRRDRRGHRCSRTSTQFPKRCRPEREPERRPEQPPSHHARQGGRANPAPSTTKMGCGRAVRR